jgi:hypothetical protein
MKTLFKAILVLLIFQSCSTGKYVSKEYKHNPSLYYIRYYSVGDDRKYDEYPNIMCQLDKCTLDEFTYELQGLPRFKRAESEIVNPLLTSSIGNIILKEIDNDLPDQEGINPAELSIKLSCIGYYGGLQVTVDGEITCHNVLVWRYSGCAMNFYSNMSWAEFNLKDWNNEICEVTKRAVKDCINHIPKK